MRVNERWMPRSDGESIARSPGRERTRHVPTPARACVAADPRRAGLWTRQATRRSKRRSQPVMSSSVHGPRKLSSFPRLIRSGRSIWSACTYAAG